MNLNDTRQTAKLLMLEEAAKRGYNPIGIAVLRTPELSAIFDAKITSYTLSQKGGVSASEENLRNYINGFLDCINKDIVFLMENADEEMIKTFGQEQYSEGFDPNTQGIS